MLSPSAASARLSGGPLAGEERPAACRRVPEDLLWFSAGLVCYLAVGVFALLHLDLALPDGYARTGQPFGVLFSRDPHFAALSLVWPPSPLCWKSLWFSFCDRWDWRCWPDRS